MTVCPIQDWTTRPFINLHNGGLGQAVQGDSGEQMPLERVLAALGTPVGHIDGSSSAEGFPDPGLNLQSHSRRRLWYGTPSSRLPFSVVWYGRRHPNPGISPIDGEGDFLQVQPALLYQPQMGHLAPDSPLPGTASGNSETMSMDPRFPVHPCPHHPRTKQLPSGWPRNNHAFCGVFSISTLIISIPSRTRGDFLHKFAGWFSGFGFDVTSVLRFSSSKIRRPTADVRACSKMSMTLASVAVPFYGQPPFDDDLDLVAPRWHGWHRFWPTKRSSLPHPRLQNRSHFMGPKNPRYSRLFLFGGPDQPCIPCKDQLPSVFHLGNQLNQFCKVFGLENPSWSASWSTGRDRGLNNALMSFFIFPFTIKRAKNKSQPTVLTTWNDNQGQCDDEPNEDQDCSQPLHLQPQNPRAFGPLEQGSWACRIKDVVGLFLLAAEMTATITDKTKRVVNRTWVHFFLSISLITHNSIPQIFILFQYEGLLFFPLQYFRTSIFWGWVLLFLLVR